MSHEIFRIVNSTLKLNSILKMGLVLIIEMKLEVEIEIIENRYRK